MDQSAGLSPRHLSISNQFTKTKATVALLHTPLLRGRTEDGVAPALDALMEHHCSQVCAALMVPVSIAERSHAFMRSGITPLSAGCRLQVTLTASIRHIEAYDDTSSPFSPYPLVVILSLSIPTETRFDAYLEWGLALHGLPKHLARVFIEPC